MTKTFKTAVSRARHGSGTLQREGKDFPRTGNLALDTQAAATVHVSFVEGVFFGHRDVDLKYEASSNLKLHFPVLHTPQV